MSAKRPKRSAQETAIELTSIILETKPELLKEEGNAKIFAVDVANFLVELTDLLKKSDYED